MTETSLEKQIDAVAGMIARSSDIVVFTGAGVSTESGIPDFRSPGGIWTKFDPEDFTIDKFLSSRRPAGNHGVFLERGFSPPSRTGPRAVAGWSGWACGRHHQNVDNLHQKAGTTRARLRASRATWPL